MAGILDILTKTGSNVWDAIQDFVLEDGGIDVEKILPLILAGVGQNQGWWDAPNQKIGYQGKIPDYTAVRNPVDTDYGNVTRMPGQVGQRYLSDIRYATEDELPAAQAASQQQALNLATQNAAALEENRPFYDMIGNLYTANRAPLFEPKPDGTAGFARGGIVDALAQLRGGGTGQRPMTPSAPQPMTPPAPQPMAPTAPQLPSQASATARNAVGDAFARQNGQFMQGPGDGMSDSIPAYIGGQQPAALGDGEFVVPADAVSHLGNGSSNAGANQLQSMIDRVRQARTGQTGQGRQINPNNFLLG
jgi:hypothetical protein